ncbi:MAG: hypothetical protein ACRYFK_06570 [Janthinobacterium lividum]
MTPFALSFRPYLATLLCAFALLFTAACGSDKGKVEGTNMLYGSGSKTWVTDKQTDAAGDKVAISDATKDAQFTFSSGMTFTATEGGQNMNGAFAFDQAAKKLTLTPQGSPTAMDYTIETLTDDKLTLVGTSGAKMMLKAK